MTTTLEKVESVDFQAFLESTPDLYLILSRHLKIVAVSNAYLKATMVQRSEIIGRDLFDVFPDNPSDPNNGVNVLRASLDRVIHNKIPDVMAVQKYDIRRPESEGGGYEERYWSPINSPILDKNNNVVFIIHRAEDVTQYIKLKEQEGSQKELVNAYKNYVDKVEIEIYKRAQQLQESNKRLRAINAELTETKTRLMEMNTKLKMSQKRFQLIIESTKDYAIFMLDPQGYITTWNAGAEAIKGYKESEIIGEHFSIFYTKEDLLTRHPDKELQYATMNGRYEEQGWRVRKSGERFWANVIITALHNEEDALIGFSKITRDMTDVKKSETMKSEFISVVSHELRTPLTSIQGSLDLILAGTLGKFSPKARKILKIAYRNSERLALLVNDILDIEKVESGLMALIIEEVNLVNLIQEVIDANFSYANKFNVTINFVTPTQTILVAVDIVRLTQVMTNLLSNAIKFSPQRSNVDIVLEIRDNESTVRINVIDHGPGIDEDFRKRIFQKFSQADSSSRRKRGGTGLGLSISKTFIEKLGSSLEFTTELGKGTCFYFDLPIIKK